MQNEQSYLGEEGREKDAGEASLERSERSERSGSEASPAARPAAGGGSFPVPEEVPECSESAAECAIPPETSEDELTADAAPPAGEEEAWEGPAPWIPNLTARRRGTLAQPTERQQPPLTPQQKLLLLDTWQRSGLPAADFGAGASLAAYALCLEAPLRTAGTGGPDGTAAGCVQRQPLAGADQAVDPHAQDRASGLGLPADQRHARAGSSAARQPGGRGARVA